MAEWFKALRLPKSDEFKSFLLGLKMVFCIDVVVRQDNKNVLFLINIFPFISRFFLAIGFIKKRTLKRPMIERSLR